MLEKVEGDLEKFFSSHRAMNITGKLSYEYTLFDVSFLEKFLKIQMNSH